MTNVKTLLLTRPEAQSRALLKEIETKFPGKAICLISPMMTITPIGDLPDTSKFQAVLFSSVNGVQAFTNLGGSAEKCYCVGERTTQAALAAGLNAVSANGAAAELVALVAKDLTPTGGSILHVRGEHTTGDIAEKLTFQGFEVGQAVLYEQQICELTAGAREALERGDVQGVPLYSPLTARRFADILTKNPSWPMETLTALCISRNVASELQNLTFQRVEIATKPNGPEMLALIGRFLR